VLLIVAVAKPVVLVLMGVSGSGKTTVARILADGLGWAFEEGDILHPQSNIEKMSAGHPLTDADRERWLATAADWVDGCLDSGESGLITCSALKRRYRDVINRRGSGVVFVFLDGTRATIDARLAACGTFHALEPSRQPARRPRGSRAGRTAHPPGYRTATKRDRSEHHARARTEVNRLAA
jgi:carbohydrate kinase (thermoresistant glucokinase family)